MSFPPIATDLVGAHVILIDGAAVIIRAVTMQVMPKQPNPNLILYELLFVVEHSNGVLNNVAQSQVMSVIREFNV